MKKGFNLLMILCAVALALSCNKTKSYTDYLKDERKKIDRFMNEQGFVKLKDFPSDGVFGEKEYVELQNGVYFHIIDSGNGNRPVPGTTILSRAKGIIFSGDTMRYEFDGFKGSSGPPLEFKYGSAVELNGDALYISPGFVSALDFVGDSSFVSMIVPFRVGSTAQQSTSSGYGLAYQPIYFERVRFIFEK